MFLGSRRWVWGPVSSIWSVGSGHGAMEVISRSIRPQSGGPGSLTWTWLGLGISLGCDRDVVDIDGLGSESLQGGCIHSGRTWGMGVYF